MNVAETTRLCRAIAGVAPAQRFEDETPALWAGILADVRLADALEAVKRLARRQAFIAPADIVGEVRAIRARRLDGVDRLAHLADTPEQWREIIRRVADGDVTVPAAVEGTQDPRVRAALPGVFRKPPKPLAIDRAEPKAAPPPVVVDEREAAVAEDERRRQLDALSALLAAQRDAPDDTDAPDGAPDDVSADEPAPAAP